MEKKANGCSRAVCCLILVAVIVVVAVTVAMVTLKLTGYFDETPYQFTPSAVNSTLCNGLESNCGWRANEIMYAGVHNAMSSKEDGFLKWNNLLSLEASLGMLLLAPVVDSGLFSHNHFLESRKL